MAVDKKKDEMIADDIIRGEDVLYNFPLYKDEILNQDEDGHKETMIRIGCTLKHLDQIWPELLENLYSYFIELSYPLKIFFWSTLVISTEIKIGIITDISNKISSDMIDPY